MRKKALALFAAAALLSGTGCTQDARPGYGAGYGPMMGGYGGPGMMGGYGGYGPGMMGGYGMGPGMMGGGYGYLRDLTPEQRTKIAEIQRDARARQWPLMQQMHELMWSDAADEQAQPCPIADVQGDRRRQEGARRADIDDLAVGGARHGEQQVGRRVDARVPAAIDQQRACVFRVERHDPAAGRRGAARGRRARRR